MNRSSVNRTAGAGRLSPVLLSDSGSRVIPEEEPLPTDLDLGLRQTLESDRGNLLPIAESTDLVERPADPVEKAAATAVTGFIGGDTGPGGNDLGADLAPDSPTRFGSGENREVIAHRDLCAYRTAARWVQVFIVAAQWAFIVTALAALAEEGISAPLRRTAAGDLSAGFWIWLSFPTAFFAGVVGSFVAQRGVSAFNRLVGHPDDAWFYPVFALRDCSVIGAIFAWLYGALVWLLHAAHPGQIPLSPVSFAVAGAPGLHPGAQWLQRSDLAAWFLWRGVPAVIVGALTMAIAGRFKFVDFDALIGIGRSATTFVWYGVIIAAGVFCFPQTLLMRWAFEHRERIWVIAPAIAAGFCLLLILLGGGIAAKLAHRYRMDRGTALPVTIAVVGPTKVGKTVFIARAYSLLNEGLVGMFRITPVDDLGDFEALRRQIEEQRTFPKGTEKATNIPFVLRETMDELVQFSWLDLSGEVFTNPTEYEGAVDEYKKQLSASDAMVMFIDARELVQGNGRPEAFKQRIYLDQIDALLSMAAREGKLITNVPLAIVVAQSGRFPPEQRREFPGMVGPILSYYENSAVKSGRKAPPVRVFLSTAIMAHPANWDQIPPRPEPLESDQCREPLLWLAAEVLRANLSALEASRGFFGGARLLRYIRGIEHQLYF